MLLLLLWRFSRGHLWALLPALGALSGLSLAVAIWSVSFAPSAAYYLLPSRAWELLLGAMVAVFAARRPAVRAAASWATPGAAAGLALVLASVFAFDASTPFPGLAALVPTVGTALVIACARPDETVGRLLASRPLVHVGLISYGAYLWYQPLFAFARHMTPGEPGLAIMLPLALLAFALAVVTYVGVERPLRDRGRTSVCRLFVVCGAMAALLAVSAQAGRLSGGFPERLGSSLQTMKGADWAMPGRDNGHCFYSVDTQAGLPIGARGQDCTLGSKEATRRALLFGDSFAAQYEPFWDVIGQRDRIAVDAVTTNWCHPYLGEAYLGPRSSRAFAQCLSNRRFLAEHLDRYDAVILGGDWGRLLEPGAFDDLERFLDVAASRAPLLVLMPAPRQYDVNVMDAVRRSFWHGWQYDPGHAPEHVDLASRQASQRLQHWAGRYGNVIVLPRSALFNVPGQGEDLTTDGWTFSLDGRHIRVGAAREAARNFGQSPAATEFRRGLEAMPARAEGADSRP